MRRTIVIKNMLGAGLDTQIAEKAADAKLTLTKLRKMAAKELEVHFADYEVEAIEDTLKRQPFDDFVITELVEKCDWACCLCWNLDRRSPIIIHHIVEHSTGRDDSYDNIVVLCLEHHGTAHTRCDLGRPPAPPELIKNRKKEFEKAIAESRAGTRPPPGREGDGSNPETQSDVQSLKRLGEFMNRPAMFRPINRERNMRDFFAELENIFRALSVGKLATRQGDDLGSIKPILSFSNPQWRDRLELLRDHIDNIRLRLEIAERDLELTISPDGNHYHFENPDLVHEIDEMKRVAASFLTSVLVQANLPGIRGPHSFG